MRLLARVLLGVLVLLIGVQVLLIATLFIGLNTGAGRQFVVGEVNHFAVGQIRVAGLGGHFPADLKLAHLSVLDREGAWASADGVELRWRPAALLRRDVQVTSLTAVAVNVTRQPAPAKPSGPSSFKLPKFHLDVDHIAINTLSVSAALAGQPTVLAVSGGAHLQSTTEGKVALSAVAAGGRGNYQVQGAIDAQAVRLVLHLDEPPDGLLGHFAGPQVHEPFMLDLTLAGPRANAALKFAAALGAAKLNGVGTLGLNPDAPKADVVLTVPTLAPVAAVAGQNIAGATTLHLVAATQPDHSTDVAVDGQLALTEAPGPAAKLVGPDGAFSLRMKLANQAAVIDRLDITGAGFALGLTGKVGQAGVDLTTHLDLKNVALLAPQIGGEVTENGTLAGTAKDFAVHAVIAGRVTQRQIPSGPFTLTLDARHLPKTPAGTLTADGMLENAPLKLDAAFARDAAGNATAKIATAAWRSLRAEADLALAAGAKLPTGSATFAVKRLADFAAFAPLPISGAVDGSFAHRDAQDFALRLNARNIVVAPALGAIDAQIGANGPMTALNVKLAATVARLMNAPARLAASARLDLDDRSATLASLNASWRGLDAVLRGPAGVRTRPGIAVQHLDIGIAGGSVSVDGTISPRLALRVAVNDLPVSLAELAAPTIDASGSISAAADLAGTLSNPSGRLTLTAARIRLHGGPAAALPAANLTAAATLSGRTANLNLGVNAGPNIALAADGLVPLSATGPISLHLSGRLDLRLLDPILAAAGSTVRGVITPDLTVTGTAAAPRADGTVVLADGSVANIGTGLSLTEISAHIGAAGEIISLQDFSATAGQGTISGHGTLDLGAPGLPVALTLNAASASPVSSDLVTESLNAALTLKGALRGALAMGGTVDILKANINIPKSLPPSVANLPILNRGAKPPPPPPPAPDIALALGLNAANQIFIRGDGLFAELGGHMRITGTAAHPNPQGGFTLIRGSFSLTGKTLQFTQGTISFNGDGFMPTLDLEASTTNAGTTAILVIGGTAAKPTITLTSTPALPSDEVLSQLLFGKGTASLTPFQAASLAAALAQLSGVGGGGNPLDRVRNALGLDELSLGGSGSSPTLQAGRYVAPGVYVGAQQGANGQGSQATVQINLYKGLKLTTTTGASTTQSSGNASSVGLSYQFNY